MILLESTKTAAATGARMRRRQEIDGRFKWNLNDIFPDWAAWEASYRTLETRVDEFAHGARRSQGNLIAHGATFEEILAGSPDLEREDIR